MTAPAVSIAEQLRRFIVEDLRYDGPVADLTDDFALIEHQVVDSMGLFELVSYLERQFGTVIDDDDLVAGNFATIGAMTRFIASRAAPAPSEPSSE